MAEHRHSGGTLPARWAVIIILACLLGTVAYLVGLPLVPSLVAGAISNVCVAGLVLASAGGLAWPLVRLLAPASAPAALRAGTSAIVGAWGMSALVLLANWLAATLGPGVAAVTLSPWLWWAVLAGGAVVTAAYLRRPLRAWSMPRSFDGRVLVWAVLAVAMGYWLVGVSRPPGFTGLAGTPQTADVTAWHLQYPRELLASHGVRMTDHIAGDRGLPTGAHMLFELAMILRGGAYEGAYAAQAVGGAFGLLAVLMVMLSLRPHDDARGRIAAMLLGTTPLAIYLGMLAVPDLWQVAALACSALWLRQWLAGPLVRCGICVGISAGVACAGVASAAAMSLLPVLAVMLLASLRPPARLAGFAAAAVAAMLPALPWMIACGYHPAKLLGSANYLVASAPYRAAGPSPAAALRGSATQASSQPAIAASQATQSAGAPPGGQASADGPAHAFIRKFVLEQRFGPLTMILLAVGLLALPVAWLRKAEAFDLAMAGLLAAQLGAWAVWGWRLDASVLLPAAVPMVLLVASLLVRLAGIAKNPFTRAASGGGPWGLAPAVAAAAAAAVTNLVVLGGVYRAATATVPVVGPIPPAQIAASGAYGATWKLPAGSRLLVAGAGAPFYMPPLSVSPDGPDYLPGLLAAGATCREIEQQLGLADVTHVWVAAPPPGASTPFAKELTNLADPQWVAANLPCLKPWYVPATPSSAASQPATARIIIYSIATPATEPAAD
jgi:hypothetical protein